MNFDFLNNAVLTRVAAVANTPTYLYRHFRQDSSVQAFAKTGSVEDLFALVQQLAHKRDRSFEDTVLAYAALVALTYKPSDEIRAAINNQGIPRFPWAFEILEGHLASASETKVLIVTYDKATTREASGAARATPASPSAKYEQARPVNPHNPSTNVASNAQPRRIVLNGVDND